MRRSDLAVGQTYRAEAGRDQFEVLVLETEISPDTRRMLNREWGYRKGKALENPQAVLAAVRRFFIRDGEIVYDKSWGNAEWSVRVLTLSQIRESFDPQSYLQSLRDAEDRRVAELQRQRDRQLELIEKRQIRVNAVNARLGFDVFKVDIDEGRTWDVVAVPSSSIQLMAASPEGMVNDILGES